MKKANKRMRLLTTVASFSPQTADLKAIYKTYIRSVLEQSAVVWHSGLTIKKQTILRKN